MLVRTATPPALDRPVSLPSVAVTEARVGEGVAETAGPDGARREPAQTECTAPKKKALCRVETPASRWF